MNYKYQYWIDIIKMLKNFINCEANPIKFIVPKLSEAFKDEDWNVR